MSHSSDDDQTIETVVGDDQMVVDPSSTIQNHSLAPTCPQKSIFSRASVEFLRKAAAEGSSSSSCKSGLEHEASLPDIIRSAAAAFINSADDHAFPLVPPCNGGMMRQQVELVLYLLRAAEEMGRQRYKHAIGLLNLCDSMSSETGNLTQRVVRYLAQALREKASKKTTTLVLHHHHHMEAEKVKMMEEAMAAPSPIVAVIYGKIPFYQVGQLAGVQAIVDSMERSRTRRIHIIDLRIRNGMQWTALIQALSYSLPRTRRGRPPLELLKITALITSSPPPASSSSSETLALQRLATFAKSMDVPFAFRAVLVPNMLQIQKDQFDIHPQDCVAVFSEYALQGLLTEPDELEALMVVIRKIRPKIMVVIETEANLNCFNNNFAHRFVEVLFHYGAYFDCVDACLESGDKMLVESVFLKAQVNGILVKEEGDQGMTRTVTVDVWRRFFRRFWMVETSLSPTALDTVNLLLGKFPEGSRCRVDLKGRSLVVGWDGIPIFSLSTWNFLVAKPLSRIKPRQKTTK